MKKLKLFFIFGFLIMLQIVTYTFAEKIISFFIMLAKSQGITIMNTSLLDSLNEVINLSIYLSIIILIPICLYLGYLWGKDALYDNERKLISKSFSWLILPIVSFFLGLFITYKVITPFLIEYSKSLGILPTTTINSLIMLYLVNGFIMTLLSLFPVITKLLNNFNILTKKMLQSARAKVYLISIFLIAVITPTTDAVSLIIMILPLILYYESSILICKEVSS